MEEDEELSERQRKILDVIIKNYLETGEPVGSRTISKSSDLNLSSATIRNEMSDLEEMGYILQPHTSAGRIPSDRGYRFYVNELMVEKETSPPAETSNQMLVERTDRLEKMLRQVVDILAANTQYTSMISAPAISGVRVRFVQLSALNERQILSVVVMDGNSIKNRIIDVDSPIDNEDLLKLNMLLNTNLSGLTVNDINLTLIQKMKQSAGEYSDIIENVLENVAGTIEQDEGRTIFTSGTTNIFKYPELSDANRASHLISTFENKEELENLINDIESDEEGNPNGIQVYIGDDIPNMPDVSLVTAKYDLGDGFKGTIGILGPKRMDYENVMKNLKSLKKQLKDIVVTSRLSDRSEKPKQITKKKE
ncbi:heat-inducible transcriptional repressor HrcA [Candidatus Weimeria sp. HCP3S3_B5]|uniref:heat-inducible transcriptional repressor HrcA n=1 Tax=Candidatus Weimeria sp. HCP3S3_B5 TaxID=3438871 RepID=UPI002A96148C|nr:heat-inducible transcriptional repressor HrcA [Lachnospiraceae bacterium]MDY6352148.1 heat-inducible transcriptional repressor HrcA [Lachnospiraceae bacterium]